MLARKRLHFFAVLLCFWLPLQAIAGQWLHCAQLQNIKDEITQRGPSHANASCHQVTEAKLQATDHQAADTDSPKTSLDSLKSCKHCQFMCHWHCVLLVNSMDAKGLEPNQVFTPFKLPSPAQPLLALPQKPPQQTV